MQQTGCPSGPGHCAHSGTFASGACVRWKYVFPDGLTTTKPEAGACAAADAQVLAHVIASRQRFMLAAIG